MSPASTPTPRAGGVRAALALAALLVLATAAAPARGAAPTATAAPAAADAAATLRVNQVGYTPAGPKGANLVTDAKAPLPWELLGADGAVVARGRTVPRGPDAAAGEAVHRIDFSSVRTPGTGYRLRAGGAVSHPFTIAPTLYRALRKDALAFFYHQRSGAPIEAKHVGAAHARPAGHLGVAPNQGDTLVPCVPGACSYSLDVRGGWYDAADQGKYVVNGGFAVWQLVHAWERAGADRAALGDGAQPIPEQGNGVPDVLDEARWELEFLLRMQVPDGQILAGLAHHKVHDLQWTPIPTRPDKDPQPRHLRPPSTAATLNLAATAAQCARVWKALDPAFAGRCLVAAEKAWAAAQKWGRVQCPPGGGGADYADSDFTDEQYWAAAELFATTGKPAYLQFLRRSPHALGKGIPADGFSWSAVSALGDLTLALVPTRLPDADKARLRKALVAAADRRLAAMKAQGYPVPYRPADGKYAWGSNALVLDQIVLLAVAHDLTGDARYRTAAFEAMDYLLGRNALDLSYVTGYGTRFPRSPHHRFFAHAIDPALPPPPPGALAGGPDSRHQDPVAQARLEGCAPQRCYLDDARSLSTNEVGISSNAALVWVSAWLDQHAR